MFLGNNQMLEVTDTGVAVSPVRTADMAPIWCASSPEPTRERRCEPAARLRAVGADRRATAAAGQPASVVDQKTAAAGELVGPLGNHPHDKVPRRKDQRRADHRSPPSRNRRCPPWRGVFAPPGELGQRLVVGLNRCPTRCVVVNGHGFAPFRSRFAAVTPNRRTGRMSSYSRRTAVLNTAGTGTQIRQSDSWATLATRAPALSLIDPKASPRASLWLTATAS